MRKAIIFLIAALILPCIGWGYGNNQALEIIAPKASGTGSPAISSNHRCFRAYPGITYEFRAQVIGGAYPYVFSLSNAPDGMTINRSTGVITWANPQTSASNITLAVQDRDGDSASSSWSITVGTSGFLFVNSSYSGTETGTISQPFNSIQDLLDLDRSHESDFVYFRTGSYPVPTYHPDYGPGNGCSLSYDGGKPHIWMGYPGESVTIDMDEHYFCTGQETTPYYFGRLRFYNSSEYGFAASSRSNYATFYRCEFDTLTTGRSGNGNQGFYFTFAEGTGNHLVFQDCEFHDYTGTAGIGSLYSQNKMLIEGCRFYNQYAGITSICTAIAAKSSIANSTFRRNEATISEGSVLGTGVNGMFTRHAEENYSDNNEICFNYFAHNGGGRVHTFNNNGNQRSLYHYRNTTVGSVVMLNLVSPDSCEGPWYFDSNVFQNSASGLTYHDTCENGSSCITSYDGNLGGTTGLVDGSGLLVNRDYVGTYGWEIAESEYYEGSGNDCSNTPGMCGSQSACEDAGWHWCDGTCQASACEEEPHPTPVKTSTWNVPGTVRVR